MLILVCSVVSGVSSVKGSAYVNALSVPIVLGVDIQKQAVHCINLWYLCQKQKPHPKGWGFCLFDDGI